MRMSQRKSQTEILGLAIVVALILMAAIFVIRFVALKSPTDYRKGFTSSELASNMLNSFLKTNAVDCRQLTMTELLQDCAQSESICCRDCNDADISNHVNSCKFVNQTALEIFDHTFGVWHTNYEFLAYKEINRPLMALGRSCISEKRSKLYPVPINAGTMYVKLDICG